LKQFSCFSARNNEEFSDNVSGVFERDRLPLHRAKTAGGPILDAIETGHRRPFQISSWRNSTTQWFEPLVSNVKRGGLEEIHHLESRTRQCDIFIKAL
jgi:hypothetical protein